MPECRRLSVQVANVAGVFADDVTDLAVGLLIHVLMTISAAHRCVADLARTEKGRVVEGEEWRREGGGRIWRERERVCVVGGRKKMMRCLKSFDMDDELAAM